MEDASTIYLAKAHESLDGAESEFANARYNNCANRCYYASFQAAIYALMRAGIHAQSGVWEHSFVHAQFVGQLINRRKVFPSRLRDTLIRNLEIRQTADYRQKVVSSEQADRTLERTRVFVLAVDEGGEHA